MTERFYILDFDGVICDSREECMITSFNADRRLRGAAEPDFEGRCIASESRALFRKYRFLARTAREYKLLWDLIESGQPISSTQLIRDQVAADEAELAVYERLFYEVRAQWREQDSAGWLAENPIFVNVAAKAVRWMEADRLAVVSAKDRGSILAIMSANGFPLDESVVWAIDEGRDKVGFFSEIRAAHPHSHVVLVDDHIENLILARPFHFKLYLATWGYTADEIIRDAPRYGIEPISEAQFVAEA